MMTKEWEAKAEKEARAVLDKGTKHDSKKYRPSLLPAKALIPIYEILEYGAKKYASWNWTKVDADRYVESTGRHWNKFLEGYQEGKGFTARDNGPKGSGRTHLAHFVTNGLFMLYKNVQDNLERGLPGSIDEDGNIQEKASTPEESTHIEGGAHRGADWGGLPDRTIYPTEEEAKAADKKALEDASIDFAKRVTEHEPSIDLSDAAADYAERVSRHEKETDT